MSALCARENLELDTARFQAAEAGAGTEILRLWEATEPVVVLGRSGSISRDTDEDACARDGVPILRRESGGGAVVLAAGCINYSLILPLERNPELRLVAVSYRLILKWVIGALAVPGLEIRGLSDLAIGGRKVSGNAQRRGRNALLHHGTLLCGFDSRLAERYLKEPLRQPDYRLGRRHSEFLGNLPLSGGEVAERLRTQQYTIAGYTT
ncbi:MAG: lipoate--protein ligase family protein [Acidobacteria bacterium]|nr:lipoate--protein ligase family protein [Acidobacteriota bacterium]